MNTTPNPKDNPGEERENDNSQKQVPGPGAKPSQDSTKDEISPKSLEIVLKNIQDYHAKAAYHKGQEEEFMDKAACDLEWLRKNQKEFVAFYDSSSAATNIATSIVITKSGKKTSKIIISGHHSFDLAGQLADLLAVLAEDTSGSSDGGDSLVGFKSIDAIREMMVQRGHCNMDNHKVSVAIGKLKKRFSAIPNVPVSLIEKKRVSPREYVYRFRLKRPDQNRSIQERSAA